MKALRLLTLCFVIVGLLSLFSCSDGVTDGAPEGVYIEYETLTLRWDEVDSVRIYTVRIESEGNEPVTVDLTRNYYSLESLSVGEYSVSVSFERDGKSSPYSEPIPFVREAECGLIFNLTDGGYEVSGVSDASGIVKIPETYRQKKVVAIAEEAFFGKSDITEVIIPESVRTIGSFAFSNCSYLEKVNLPSGLISLGEGAFSGCRMLGTELTLPSGLSEIPKSAFAYCSSIEKIHFGENILSIGDNAFTDLSHLKEIKLPSSLTKIGAFSFAACAEVEKIEFPTGLLEIGEFAFSKAMSLTEIILPDSLLTLGKGAFYHSSALSSVALGASLREVGDSAFLETAVYNNSPTNEIYVGDWFVGLKDTDVFFAEIREGCVGIANGALYANKYISSLELPSSVRYIGESAFAVSNLVSVVTGSGVKEIGDQAFLYCEKLIDVILGSYDYVEQTIKESSLEVIGTYAFMNCTKLARIDIPSSVKDIGAYAFRNTEIYNSALTGAVYADGWIVDYNKTLTESLTVDRGTVGIARYAFYNCTGLKNVRIDNSVKYIGKGAFYNCASLETVVLPDTLSRIEDYTFYNCASLKLTSLPPMLREIGRAAFYMCGTADSYVYDTAEDILEIPAGVTYIGDYAFFGCGLKRADSMDGNTESAGIDIIRMGQRIEYIGKGAFRGFASLRSVVIGGALVIGDRAFYECPMLEEITVADRLISVGDKAFYKCSSLGSVTFPSTLKMIGKYSFYKCSSLGSIELGGGLERINDGAFFGCTSLSSITLSESCSFIGEGAFRDCKSLSFLILSDNIESVGAHAVYGCDSLTVYIEADTDLSRFESEWNSSFATVILGCEISPEGYVRSVRGQDKNIINKFEDTVISSPLKDGYIFAGLSSSENSDFPEYTLEDIAELYEGEILYFIYTPID